MDKLIPNPKFAKLADQETIDQTISALKQHGISAEFVENGAAARKKALQLIPENSQVMTLTSQTLEALGLDKEINESGRYDAVRPEMMANLNKVHLVELKAKANLPEWAVGSAHAVTRDGKVLIASNTGSQLTSYVYGANHVLWIVGAQKLVSDLDEGLKRIYEYSFPKEDARARQAYGTPSAVNKILIVNGERTKDRAHMIIVGENLGF
jgi:hypothetical protein